MNGTQTLNRALDILFALSEANGTLTVSEIAEKVSISESSTYRFLQTLEQNGVVERKGKSRIALGLRILDLARSLNMQFQRDLLPLALPIMEELSQKTTETSMLVMRTGSHAVCLQSVKGTNMIQFSIDNGRMLPLHRGAAGKCIVAFESEKIRERILRTLDPEQASILSEQLEIARTRRYIVSTGEVDADVFAVAAPIIDLHGHAIASLSVASPSYRCTPERDALIIEEVVRAASELSRNLGTGE